MPDIKNPMTAWAIIQGRVCHTPKVSAGDNIGADDIPF
jgi:hypothetical protein